MLEVPRRRMTPYCGIEEFFVPNVARSLRSLAEIKIASSDRCPFKAGQSGLIRFPVVDIFPNAVEIVRAAATDIAERFDLESLWADKIAADIVAIRDGDSLSALMQDEGRFGGVKFVCILQHGPWRLEGGPLQVRLIYEQRIFVVDLRDNLMLFLRSSTASAVSAALAPSKSRQNFGVVMRGERWLG